jgi:hypothetical protein
VQQLRDQDILNA